MNNNDIFVIPGTRSAAATPGRNSRTLVEESLPACVNVLLGLRSNVVALPVADGHHAYLSWVASSTRAP